MLEKMLNKFLTEQRIGIYLICLKDSSYTCNISPGVIDIIKRVSIFVNFSWQIVCS